MTDRERAQGAGQDRAPAEEHARLAQAYQDAARDDAYHARGAAGAPGEQPSTLVPKKEGEGAPSTDPAPEDKVVLGSHRAPDGAANGSATVSDEALQRGLTPGEMGAGQEPQQTTRAKPAPRYTDAELSGIESGETGEETRQREAAFETDRDAPDALMADASRPDDGDGEAEEPARQPSRYTDAELSGLEPGETSAEG